MPITVKAASIVEVANVLAAVEQLSPPPLPKGRYALGKSAKAALGPAQFHLDKTQELRVEHAKKDGGGKPVTTDITINGQPAKKYEMVDEAAFNAALKAIGEEEVTLEGCRMITHAELGACPITAYQERVLIDAGLLDDKEPE